MSSLSLVTGVICRVSPPAMGQITVLLLSRSAEEPFVLDRNNQYMALDQAIRKVSPCKNRTDIGSEQVLASGIPDYPLG